jgi:hypothetical protein
MEDKELAETWIAKVFNFSLVGRCTEKRLGSFLFQDFIASGHHGRLIAELEENENITFVY